MTDYIAELQLKALEIIQREGLEEEYNKYMICKGHYYHQLPYTLIDFILQYTAKQQKYSKYNNEI